MSCKLKSNDLLMHTNRRYRVISKYNMYCIFVLCTVHNIFRGWYPKKHFELFCCQLLLFDLLLTLLGTRIYFYIFSTSLSLAICEFIERNLQVPIHNGCEIYEVLVKHIFINLVFPFKEIMCSCS